MEVARISQPDVEAASAHIVGLQGAGNRHHLEQKLGARFRKVLALGRQRLRPSRRIGLDRSQREVLQQPRLLARTALLRLLVEPDPLRPENQRTKTVTSRVAGGKANKTFS
jgi:hypothetical protein